MPFPTQYAIEDCKDCVGKGFLLAIISSYFIVLLYFYDYWQNGKSIISNLTLQGSCKPVWLFMAGGEVVSVLDGPNVTLLRSKVVEECGKEEQVISGGSRRNSITIEEAVPSKKNDFD